MLFRRLAVALAAPLLLTACIFTPGKFTSAMTVTGERFTFAYKGEVVFISAYDVGDAMNTMGEQKCYGPVPDDGGMVTETEDSVEIDWTKERPCTAAEKAEQTKSRADNAERQKKEREQAAKMFGFDPTDEATIRDFTTQLTKQAGWKSVVHKGKGVFEIDYQMSGTLDRDFVFPVFPKANVLFPMLIARRRTDGSVQVSAPAFAQFGAGMGGMGGMGAMMGMGAMAGMTGTAPNAPKPPMPDGMFTLSTDAEILTNNTEDGPSMAGATRTLSWKVNATTEQGPETLLRLKR